MISGSESGAAGTPTTDDIQRAAARLFEARPIEHHPLFVALESGDLDARAVRALALQIHHVVDHFPRFLAALLANLPDYRLRMELVENLYVEHGRLDPAHVHVETYKVFLRALGCDDQAIAESRPIVPVVAYVRAVGDLCLHQPYAEALGALGVIEEIVARASPLVARFARRIAIDRAETVHFADHETLDLSHAREIYGIAARSAEGDQRALVERGLELGFYYHQRLYSDLAEAFAGSRTP